MSEGEGKILIGEVKGFKLVGYEKPLKVRAVVRREEYRQLMEMLKEAIAKNPKLSYYEIELPKDIGIKRPPVPTFQRLLEEYKLEGWKVGQRKKNITFVRVAETETKPKAKKRE